MKWNYLVIIGIVFLTSFTGSIFTTDGIENGWYESIVKPEWTPDGMIIGIVWTVLFFLLAISAILYWNRVYDRRKKNIAKFFFFLNLALNVLWSYFFFAKNSISGAFIEAIFLALSILILILISWKDSKVSSILIIPYFAWVVFATYLTYTIMTLN